MSHALQISCITRHYYPTTLDNLKKLCAFTGTDFKLNEELTCCGLPYFEKGELKTAKVIGEYNISVISQGKLICSSSKCLSTYTLKYPKIFNNTVSHNNAVHLSKNSIGIEYLANKLSQNFLDAIEGHFFLVRDCCSNDWLTDFSQKMISCIWKYSELNATCCGAGSSMPSSDQNLASGITLNLIHEFKQSGADTMVFEDDICRKQVENVAAKEQISVNTMNICDLFMQNQK